MKAWGLAVLEVLLVVLLLPQAFVLCYYFGLFFAGGGQARLLQTLALYALTISWVSAPFLAALTLLVRRLVGARVRWFVMLPLCVGAGYLWLAAWNLLVLEVFSYLRAAVPIVLCSAGAAGWAMARALYLESLAPQEKQKVRRRTCQNDKTSDIVTPVKPRRFRSISGRVAPRAGAWIATSNQGVMHYVMV